MNDNAILSRIQQLVDEEHALLQLEAAGQLSDPQQARMQGLQESLDQCWDLLRQRRARRAAGLNPDEAQVRPVETVEHYLQ
jgi:Protein of unknown function (DUF2630)